MLMKNFFIFVLLFTNSIFANNHNGCLDKSINLAYYEIGNIFSSDAGRFTGLDHDVVLEMMKRSKCEYHPIVMKRARIWNEILNDGLVDITTSAILNQERLEKLWIFPYMQLKHKVFLNEPSKKIKKIDDFMANQNLKLGIVRGYVYNDFYNKKIEELKVLNRVVEVVDDKKLFEVLDTQGVHAVISYPIVYSKYKKAKNTRGKIEVFEWNPEGSFVPAGMAFSKAKFSKEKADVWAKIISDMKKDGTLEKFMSKYISKEETRETLAF